MKRHPRLAKLKYLWAPVIFYLALIFFLSSFSFRVPWFEKSQKIHGDWLGHVVEYSLFGFLLARALWRHSRFWRAGRRVFLTVLMIGALYGAIDEFHQSFVPNRDPSVYDLMADTTGVALGAWFWIKKQNRVYA